MTEYEEIIKYRNKGFTQEEISVLIDRSLRTVGRYLSSGKIPVYKRTKPTKTDPFEKYKERAEEIIKKGVNGKPVCAVDLFRTLVRKHQGRSKIFTNSLLLASCPNILLLLLQTALNPKILR